MARIGIAPVTRVAGTDVFGEALAEPRLLDPELYATAELFFG